MQVLDMRTDFKTNMGEFKVKNDEPAAGERFNMTSLFNMTMSRRAPIIQITGLTCEMDIDLLQQSIFLPYLISNSMKVKYDNKRDQCFSIK